MVVDGGGGEMRRAVSRMMAWRMKLRVADQSIDEIGEAGRRDGSEEGGGATGDSWRDVGTVNGGDDDGDSIGRGGPFDDLDRRGSLSSDGASGSAAFASA